MPSDPGELLQLLGGVEAGAAGGADDVDAEPVAQPGLVGEQVRGGVQEDVRRLERLDAADEEQHEGVLGHADRAAGGGAVARGRTGRGRRRAGRRGCASGSAP